MSAGAVIGSGAVVEGSLVLAGAVVHPGATVVDSLIGAGAVIGERTVVHGSVIGDLAHVGADNELRHGVRIWCGAVIPDGAVRFSSDQ